MSIFSAHVCTSYTFSCVQKLEEAIESTVTGIKQSCELPYLCWEMSMGLLQEHHQQKFS